MANYNVELNRYNGAEYEGLLPKNGISGPTDPTNATVGVLNQTYLNTTTGKMFYCSNDTGGVYTWVKYAGVNDVSEQIGVVYPVINAGWKKLQSYETAGAFTWTAPDLFSGKSYKIGVMVIGGGGSGAANNNQSDYLSQGGNSGDSNYYIFVVSPNSNHSLVVGKGGASKIINSGSGNGNPGGSSSFDGIIADGGGGGFSDAMGAYAGSSQGGQKAINIQSLVTLIPNPYGGYLIPNQYDGTARYPLQNINSCFNPFESRRILGAGGFGANAAAPNYFSNGGKNPISSLGGGNGAGSQTGTVTAQNATEPGCGGGGAGARGGTATSGAGADGAVYIYIQGN